MVFAPSQESLIRLQELWRTRLEQAGNQYEQKHSPENRAALLRVLKIFSDLVLNGKMPPKELHGNFPEFR